MHPDTAISPLYARYLSLAEKSALRSVSVDDSSSEINLLRVLITYLMKFQRSAPADLHSRIHTLRTSVVLTEQLAVLVRWHDRVHGPRSDLDADMSEALAMIHAEDARVLKEMEEYAQKARRPAQ
jgi:hypothetical protein